MSGDTKAEANEKHGDPGRSEFGHPTDEHVNECLAPTVEEQLSKLRPLLTGGVMAQLLDKYRTLRLEREIHEEAIQQINQQCKVIQNTMLNKMLMDGVDSVNLPDGSNVYVRKDMHVGRSMNASGEDVVNALMMSGLSHLVSGNMSSIKSHIKELMAERYGENWNSIEADPKEVLPVEMRDMFNVYITTDAVVRGLGLGVKNKE